jgi:hypothetical protein
MPIHISSVGGPRVAVVNCDQCNQEITAAQEGVVVSRGIDIAVPHFVHRQCERAFRDAQQFVHHTMELDGFIDQLNALGGRR